MALPLGKLTLIVGAGSYTFILILLRDMYFPNCVNYCVND